MLGSLAVLVKFGFLILVAGVFVIGATALFIAATGYAAGVVKRAFSPRSVQIAKFQDLVSPRDTDRAPYLLARAEELARPVPLDALYEVKVPVLATRFGAKDDLKFLDDVKINIQGVNLPEVVKNLFAALPDDQTTVTGEAETVGTGSAMRLELKEPSGEKKSWLLRSEKPPSNGEATREIIDQAIYKMVYYLYYDPAVNKLPPTGVNFPSERALVAYYSGQQYLGAYQRKLGAAEISSAQKDAQKQADELQKQYSDLDEAERQFRILYQEMPNFTDGLMLLGITLMEQKKEAEAIGVFDRVKQNLLRWAEVLAGSQRQRVDAALAANRLNVEEKKALLSAMLFRATAERKLYRVENNHLALAEIEDVLAVIGRLHRPLPPPQREDDKQKADRQDFFKIHISVLAEKAYVLGAYLVLLNQENFATNLDPSAPAGAPVARVNPPELVALTPAILADLTAISARIQAGGAGLEQAKKDWLKAYRDRMTAIYGLHKVAVADAKALFNNVPIDDDKWKTARERFLSDLNNAAGYAQFRHAQATIDFTGKDEVFLAECKGALDNLHEAYAAHQNEQTILLNLGLIESYPRCDREGVNIERARNYLKQASALKPADYYAAQLLATLGIRELYTWGPFAKLETLKDTIDAAEKARMLRPEDGTILALVAQANILQWAQAADDAARKLAATKIEAAITQAEKRKATNVHLHTVRLQWLVNQAAKAADDKQFDDLKTKISVEVGKAIPHAQDDPGWYGHQLLMDAAALSDQLTPLNAKDRSSLHWPN
jgi:hypothetical protein